MDIPQIQANTGKYRQIQANTGHVSGSYPPGNSSKEGEMVDLPPSPVSIYFLGARGAKTLISYREVSNKPQHPSTIPQRNSFMIIIPATSRTETENQI